MSHIEKATESPQTGTGADEATRSRTLNGLATSALKFRRSGFWPCALAIASCPLLASCQEKMVPASVGGYNHMSDWSILTFTVDGAGGPNLSPGGGGGSFSCCAKIPKHWRPGMKVKVEWTYTTKRGGLPPPPAQEALVEIPEYSDRTGDIRVHFYPNHKVRVIVSNYGIEHPRYPMAAQDKLPWETSNQLIEDQNKRAQRANPNPW
ncbi:DUF3304 domain-containing protein [Variovorax paradoxus]|uniref:DUF3304 domain-containing protein n=1 Tax=Variovorax paradoxus TaxID=34073 RepID=UPI0012D4C395|nr:DUF3304 domain-containing protein [Variovorax paradoxus]